MNPQLAECTGFSDAEVIKNILPGLFESNASSARPDGSFDKEQLGQALHGLKPEIIDGFATRPAEMLPQRGRWCALRSIQRLHRVRPAPP